MHTLSQSLSGPFTCVAVMLPVPPTSCMWHHGLYLMPGGLSGSLHLLDMHTLSQSLSGPFTGVAVVLPVQSCMCHLCLYLMPAARLMLPFPVGHAHVSLVVCPFYMCHSTAAGASVLPRMVHRCAPDSRCCRLYPVHSLSSNVALPRPQVDRRNVAQLVYDVPLYQLAKKEGKS